MFYIAKYSGIGTMKTSYIKLFKIVYMCLI